MLCFGIGLQTRPCIHSNKLVENVLIYYQIVQLQLLEGVVCRLCVAQLSTSLHYGNIGYLVRCNIFSVHHMPILNGLRCISLGGSARKNN
jgi:hypothetical protein